MIMEIQTNFALDRWRHRVHFARKRRFYISPGEDIMRRICLIALTTIGLTGINIGAEAEDFPSRPITMVVPWPTGGPSDAPARILAERMRVTLGQSIIVENVSGASGSAGTGRVARATADGYTIVHGNFSTHV